MKFFKTISLKEAIDKIEEKLDKKLEIEEVSIEKALNRVIAEEVASNIDLPSFNRSTVDGYAVKAKDVHGASEFSPVLLKNIGDGKMGEENANSIDLGECMYIPTGGMLPNGSDAMVMIEDCENLGEEVLINKGVSEFSNIIIKGSEVRYEDLLVKVGERITSSHIGVLSSVGVSKVKVYKKIKFSIISTGDEIIELGKPLKIGEVYDINTNAFRALIEEGLGEVTTTFLVKDNLDTLSLTLEKAVKNANVVLISGGSSVGVRDFTERAIEDIGGEIFIHGLSLKPGKPTIVAKYKNKFIFGMPGHPQSGINVFKALVEPIFLNRKRIKIYGELGENIYGDPGKTCFINVKLKIESQKILVYPLMSKSSMIRPLLDGDGYISIPDYKEGLYKGELVEVLLND
ncbi:molybdopterin molybdotransferase MoeA [Cetobacterium somerae]|uniref:molybdopterin molybdotransferase MoeA n=1 Tax=Cetobacterium sp. NK01 TaxID=2993530 RepID=UPI00211608B0|nr:molybdopterin molybdotransferase MoeA [Cetobacterium sp. NK01]MCQ8212919.1 molybdopterin molybdotransferase MoeA [Cetobacterium sp. NK01]